MTSARFPTFDCPFDTCDRSFTEVTQLNHHVQTGHLAKFSPDPEVKAKQREYQREYHQRPEVKASVREYQRKYRQRPEVKARRREYDQRPEVKARRREYQREYDQRPDVKARKRPIAELGSPDPVELLALGHDPEAS